MPQQRQHNIYHEQYLPQVIELNHHPICIFHLVSFCFVAPGALATSLVIDDALRIHLSHARMVHITAGHTVCWLPS